MVTGKHPRSRHSGVSPNRDFVRIRHPQFPADAPPKPDAEYVTLYDRMDAMPEDNLLSLDTPCVPAADSRCYLLEDFARTLTAGTYSNSVDGDAFAGSTTYEARLADGTFTYAPHYSVTWGEVSSSLGTGNYSWTSPNNGPCTSFSFKFTGYFEVESWRQVTVPAHPTDMAGVVLGPITAHFGVGLAGGRVGIDEGALLYVASEEPSGVRSGSVITALPTDVATTVYIPSQYIPDAGGTLYVGVGPNWSADYNLGYTCSFRWPWMDGKGNSGKGYVSNWTDTWQWVSWDAAGDEWGTAVSDDENGGAWWEGNLPWQVSPSYSGTYGINGNALYLTVAAGSTQTLTAKMPGSSIVEPADDNDDAMGEPWSHELGVVMKSRFRITTAGSLTEAGTRYLEFLWNDGRDELKCQVRLGDAAFEEGIRVADSDQYAYTKKAVTEGSWMCIKFDSRNPGYLRAKMWVEGDARWSQEPPVYDVSLARNDDSENPLKGDYFHILMSAGNETGADQTIEVAEVWFCGPGDDCEWVEEHLGQGDGATNRYETSQPFKKGGLWFFVDGMHVPALPIDREVGSFYAGGGFAAAPYANLVARYLVDRNPDGD